MVSDRGLSLLVQTAARAGLDFRTADTRDRYWWIKARWILDHIESEHAVELYRLQHAQHVSVLDYTIGGQAFDEHWNSANKLLTKIYDVRFPWARDDKDKKRDSEINAMLEQWKAMYGDYNDPKVKEKYNNIAKAIHAQTAKAKASQFADQRKLGETMRHIQASYEKKRRK